MHLNIINADCVDFLKTEPDNSKDLITIDPPYNTGNTEDKTIEYDIANLAAQNWTNFHASWDKIDNYSAWCYEWLAEAHRILKPTGSIFICGSFHSIPETAMVMKQLGYFTIQWVQWCIPNAFPNRQMYKMTSANQTIIWARKSPKTTHFYDKQTVKKLNEVNYKDFWIIPKMSERHAPNKPWLRHPSKKPVALIQRMLEIALPKVDRASVIDFFGGSGTLIDAARNIQRDHLIQPEVTVVEKDPIYYEWIKDRANYTSKD